MGINVGDYEFGEEKPPVGVESYPQNCAGDSGSGQFTASMSNRYTLVAIHTKILNDRDRFKDDKGDFPELPCGSYSYDARGSKDSKGVYSKRVYLQTHTMSESITYPKTLQWIKQMMSGND